MIAIYLFPWQRDDKLSITEMASCVRQNAVLGN